MSAWGLAMRDLFNDDRPADNDDWTPYGPAISTYEYTDEKGAVLFGVSRTADKQFPQWRPDVTKRHGRTWGLEGVRRVPYHLSRLIEAVRAGATIHVVEGEKDVIAVEEAGRVATCNPGGAGKWRDEYAGYLSGADVMVIRDKDQAGDAHARDVLASLAGSTLANGCCCSTRR